LRGVASVSLHAIALGSSPFAIAIDQIFLYKKARFDSPASSHREGH
jgi:hypothetical protein